MSEFKVKFNTQAVPNFAIQKAQNKLELQIVIKNPARELQLLKEIAALSGKKNEIELDDLDNQRQKARELIYKLEGGHLYQNDGCPVMGKLNLRYDLKQALLMLTQLKTEMGPEKFEKAQVIFTESFIGEKTMSGHPPHHVIKRAEAITTENKKLFYPANNKPTEPVTKNATGAQTINLNIYENSEVLLSQTLQNPDNELKLLTEIAALDGDDSSITKADLVKAGQNKKLNSLEGLELYTDDLSDDATLYDLNAAYDFLYGAKKQGVDLSKADVVFQERLSNTGNRFFIEQGQVILNESNGQYFRIENVNFNPEP